MPCIDLHGQRFGRLLVVGRCTGKAWCTHWLCRCDCGRTCPVAGSHLRRGRTRSCGCLRVEIMAQNMSRILVHQGRALSLVEWCRRLRLTPQTVSSRLRRGWTLERALRTPVGEDGRKRA